MARTRFALHVLVILLAACGGGLALGQAVKDAPKPSAAPTPKESAASPKEAPATKDYTLEGHYVEACTCKGACAAEISGDNPGCDSVAVYQIDKGAYDGQDFSGTRVAFVIDHGDQVHLYLDAPDTARRGALEKFARAAFGPYGTINSVALARVDFTVKEGAYHVKVNDGKTLTLDTEPVLGGDKKSAVEIQNSQNVLSPTLYQGRCVSCTYADGEHKITIEKGRDSFFNQRIKSSGKV